MSQFKRFDVEVELQKLRSPAAKPANAANGSPDVSTFSDISGEAVALEGQACDTLPTCVCGNTEGIWKVHQGTCWEKWICRCCEKTVSVPPQHLCDTDRAPTDPCVEAKALWWMESPHIWTCSVCRIAVEPYETDEFGYQHFMCPDCSSFVLLPEKPGEPCPTQSAEYVFEPGRRGFLPRPLGEEASADFWAVWAPFFDWLVDHSLDEFCNICEAEEALRALERQNITDGPTYNAACLQLFCRFEKARQRKLRGQ